VEEGRRILEESGLRIRRADTLSEAASRAVEALRELDAQGAAVRRPAADAAGARAQARAAG
jgi:hypothetical protein